MEEKTQTNFIQILVAAFLFSITVAFIWQVEQGNSLQRTSYELMGNCKEQILSQCKGQIENFGGQGGIFGREPELWCIENNHKYMIDWLKKCQIVYNVSS